MQQQSQQPQPLSSRLYHVKTHGVTQEMSPHWPEAFNVYQSYVHRLGSKTVHLFTIVDRRTAAQRFPAKGH